jgi:uncharacterized protein YegJ (DUF2314 family)
MLYLQMGLVFTGSAKNAPWLVSGIIQGFANKVKVSDWFQRSGGRQYD